MFDFIVLGGGIAGASIAFELSKAARVCLIEREAQLGLHSTGRSAAMLIPTYGGPTVQALTRAGEDFLRAPPPGFCDRSLLRSRACLYIARTDQVGRLAAWSAEQRLAGLRTISIDAAEARRIVPRLRPGYVAQAVADVDAADIDVDQLHQGFLRGARGAGAEIVTEAGTPQMRRSGGVWRADIGGRVVEAPVLVNAAGAWADQVATACGALPVGLIACRRTAVLVDPPEGEDIRDWPLVIDTDETFYFKPDAGRLLLSPGDETPDTPGDAQPDELDIAVAVDRVQGALDLEVRRVSHSWAGLRTFAADRVPVVGFDPHLEGFFWCAGQGGYGIQTAPGLARTAAALACGDPAPPAAVAAGLDISTIAPARFHEARGSARVGSHA